MRMKTKIKTSLILLCTLVLIFSLFGCTKSADPKTAFTKYINSWKKQDYKGMYAELSSDSKSKLKEDDFENDLKKIYDSMKLKGITLSYKYPSSSSIDKNAAKLTVPIQVSLNTPAGDINYSQKITLVKEKQDKDDVWKISFSEDSLYPKLNAGEKIGIKTTSGKRGEIYDRNDKGLAINGTVWSIGVVPKKFNTSKTDNEAALAAKLGISANDIEKKINASWVKPDLFVPITNISKDNSQLLSDVTAIPGVTNQSISARVYPYKEAAAHLVGYMGSITAEELTKHKNEGYGNTDSIGKTGLEQVFESRLRGTPGMEIYIADKDGKKLQTLAQKKPVDGENIKLTIDINLQVSMYNQLKDDPGLGTAINPKTGEVLALLSTPSYDSNKFITGFSTDEYSSLSKNPNTPFINRFSKSYVPGSTFKIITAAIGLTEGTLDPDKTRDIKGLQWQKSTSWGKYFITRVEEDNNPVNLADAFMYSDNIYFAQTALDIGKDKFIKGVKNFGIGEKIPFSFPMTTSQLSNSGSLNTEIQLADSGYGQGEILVNPLHMALIYGSIANGGNLLDPVLETKDVSSTPKIWRSNVVSSNVDSTILNDLKKVIDDPNGTGHAAKLNNIPLAGKTGTAEIKLNSNDTKGTENGWFVAFNTDNPKILVLMMTENAKGNGGSHYVVPKVKNVLEAYLK